MSPENKLPMCRKMIILLYLLLIRLFTWPLIRYIRFFFTLMYPLEQNTTGSHYHTNIEDLTIPETRNHVYISISLL